MNHSHMPMPKNGSMDMNMTMDDMVIMHMNFYWGKNAIILFSGWPNHSLAMYILSFIFILLLAAATEVLSGFYSAKLRAPSPMLTAVAQAAIYALRMGFLYMVMLAVMSYNLGIFIAAVIGHGIGFFIAKARALAVPDQGSVPKF